MNDSERFEKHPWTCAATYSDEKGRVQIAIHLTTGKATSRRESRNIAVAGGENDAITLAQQCIARRKHDDSRDFLTNA